MASHPPQAHHATGHVEQMMMTVYMMADQIRIWEFSVDWNQPENSTFEELQQLDVEAFNYQALRCRSAPGLYPTA